jgi:SAM-dependent methyltransferase
LEYLDRRRAEGFGAVAEEYDRTRPSYPAELLARLSAYGPGRAVDVGCGTGRVALLLARAGFRVTGIEPDERMAAFARSRGVEVVVSTFERWQAPDSDLDLVASGTAWHWVDPGVGYDKAASVLRPGGRLAIFRNFYRYAAGVAAIVDRQLRLHAPHLLRDCVPLGTADPDRVDSHRTTLEKRSDLFDSLEYPSFEHARVVPVAAWIAELATHSPIMVLDGLVANQLLSGLSGQVEAEVGDHVQIVHRTHCLLARRR